MIKVLFVCVQNSARSQMAEAWTQTLCGSRVAAVSAGIEPGELNLLAIDVMREVGIDISLKSTQSVFDLHRAGQRFEYVVTVCDEASAEQCPVFPGVAKRLYWSFADPATFEGNRDAKLARTRAVRDEIRANVKDFCATICAGAMAD